MAHRITQGPWYDQYEVSHVHTVLQVPTFPPTQNGKAKLPLCVKGCVMGQRTGISYSLAPGISKMISGSIMTKTRTLLKMNG